MSFDITCLYFPVVPFGCTIISLGFQWDSAITSWPPFGSWKHTYRRESPKWQLTQTGGLQRWPHLASQTLREFRDMVRELPEAMQSISSPRGDLTNPHNILSGLIVLKRWLSPILIQYLPLAKRGTPLPPPTCFFQVPLTSLHLFRGMGGLHQSKKKKKSGRMSHQSKSV